MNPERWQRLQRLVAEAAEKPEAYRTQWLYQVCGDDTQLYEEAARMVASYLTSDNSMEEAVGFAASRVALQSDYLPGDRVAAYRITGILGHGGMGVVYRAERADDQYRQAVAIKVVRVGPGDRSQLFSRFRLERQVLANITHPHIARLVDGGVTLAGWPYLVMEFIEGISITQYALQQQSPTADRLLLFQQVCAAVQYAHQNLVVHRDLKPANILVTPDGQTKLLDFGIAKLLEADVQAETALHTVAADRLMTPDYASPEQVLGDHITTATDVYGLGLLLYELLTGVRPFNRKGQSRAELEAMIVGAAPVPPSMVLADDGPTSRVRSRVTDLDRIVLKALQKNPERRYASVLEFSADVERYLTGFPVAARPDSMQYRATRFLLRNKVAVSATAIFFITILGLSLSLLVQAKRARHEAASADAVSQYLVGLFDNVQPDATQGRSLSARDLLDSGTARLQKEWQGEPLTKARLLSTLGSVYYQLGAFDQAEKLLSESKELYVQSAGPLSVENADLANSLGEAELDQGDYEQSLRDYRESVRIFEQIRPESSALADAMDGLSGILWELGRYKESEAYHLRSIAMASRVIGADAPMTLVDKNNYAVLLVDMGRYQEAVAIDRQVLAARQKIFGEDNSHTASSMNNLAVALQGLGHLREAGDLFQRSLAIRRKIYGGNHANIGRSLVYLSRQYGAVGDDARAEQTAREAVGIALRMQTEKSLDTAFAEENLGLALLHKGDPKTARTWIERAYRIRLSQKTPSVPLLSQSYDSLGMVELAESRPVLAKANFQRALTMRLGFPDGAADKVAETYLHLGFACLQEKDPVGGEEAFQKAAALFRRSFVEEPNPRTAQALEGLGQSRLAMHQASARIPLDEASTMRRALLNNPR